MAVERAGLVVLNKDEAGLLTAACSDNLLEFSPIVTNRTLLREKHAVVKGVAFYPLDLPMPF